VVGGIGSGEAVGVGSMGVVVERVTVLHVLTVA
jgi:hypothetical protein